ncbi:MAG: protein-glutamate O-methyltransferase CheR [Desulfobacterales bacterium]|nr:protein-glutamate O-methyltransferase CheR [Desulfobacterales bacterium]
MKITDQEYSLFKNFIKEHCGISLGENKKYLLETRLGSLIAQNGCKTFTEFYYKLKNSTPRADLHTLFIDSITTNETLWFRDKYPFKILEEKLFPQYKEEILSGQRKEINIWSAGCSTGQEPYSIAIIAFDFFNSQKDKNIYLGKINILATDISNRVLSIASLGKYDDIAINRGMPQKYLDSYFKKDKNQWILDEKIKKLVQFKTINFKNPTNIQKTFDIIFLRNVIIYFSDELKQKLIDSLANILSPKGFLFLGTGETASGYSSKFDIIDEMGAIYYKVKKS